MAPQLTYHSLLQRLDAVRKKEKFLFLLRGILIFISVGLLSLLLFLTINAVFHINSTGRILIDALFIGVAFLILLYFIFRPIFSLIFRKHFPSYSTLADRIGNKFPTIRDRLLNALQIYTFYTQNREGYSLELIEAALNEINDESKNKDFQAIVNTAPLKQSVRLMLLTSVIFVFVVSLFSTNFFSSANQLLHPFTSFNDKSPFELTIFPGNIEVIKDDDVEIKVLAQGEIPDQITLHLKDIKNGYNLEKKFHNNKNNIFQYTIESIKDSTEYYISTESMITERYLISVIELPMVRNLQLKLNFPLYSQIESRFLDENVGDVTALKGSTVDIRIQANKNLKEANLIFKNKKRQQLKIRGNTAKGRFNILSNDTYYVALKDQSGRTNMDPIKYRINVIEDNFPTVKITVPGRDVDITEEMLLMLSIEGEDDFGFSNLQLASRTAKDSFNFIPLRLQSYQLEKFRLNYEWDLSNLNLFPEDVVTYYVEIFDNDNISGPKSAKSLTYRIRFPSIYEIYTEVQQEHEQAFETVEGMYQQSKELKEKLSELVRQMKKDANINWEEKKQLEDVIKTQRQMQQTLEEVGQKLDQMIERMEKNDLISMETLKKYHELQQLFQEMMTEELKDAIRKLQKAIENIDSEELQRAAEKLNINQQDFLRSLEKTLSILKRLQIEQRLDEVARKAAQLLKEQKELLEKAKQSTKEDGNDLAKKQQDIQHKTEALKRDLAKLTEKMSQFPEMPISHLNAAIDMMDRQQLTENMGLASRMFQAGNMSSAQSHGQKAQSSLSELTALLQKAKQEFTQAQKQQVMAEMNSLSHNLLSLSMSQEQVLKSGKNLSRNSPQLEKIADRQQDLISGLSRTAERVGNLSNKTFFITPEIIHYLGKSLLYMQQSLRKMEERNGKQSISNQGKAMISLNEAIKQMRKSMQNLAASGSSVGLEEMLERLSQMSGKQQGINQQTMQFGIGGQPLSLQQQAALARLAAEQAALKRSLEQLQQEFGNRSEILGRLDNIADEMDEVIKDLQNKNISRRTINRQRKILSRLLDAQKSVQRRDYSRKRKSETGKFYLAKSPNQLPVNHGEHDFQLRHDLLKALKEGYARDYQQLIKKYFEALINERENH